MQRAVLFAKAEGKSYSSQMASFVEEAIVSVHYNIVYTIHCELYNVH